MYWPWEHFSLPFPSTTLPLPPAFPLGLYIYQGALQASIVPVSKLTDRCPAPQCGRAPRESRGGRQSASALSHQAIHNLQRSLISRKSSWVIPPVPVEWRSDVLTLCCWGCYLCCSWGWTASWERRQVERSTECPRMPSKVHSPNFLLQQWKSSSW